jgi:hypothetical protein
LNERTFRKSTAHSRFTSNEPPSMTGRIEFQEECSLCVQPMINGAMCLRNDQTKNAICVLCMVGIAEVV